MTTTIQDLKKAIIEYVKWVAKQNETGNNTYEQVANSVYVEKIHPFVKNEEITGWEKDIKKKFFDNPYVRFEISEKQAYCLARAFASINQDTITA